MSVRAIVFDLGDTLFRLDPLPDVQPGLATMLSRQGLVEAGMAGEAAARLLSHVSERRSATIGLVESNLPRMFEAAFKALGMSPTCEASEDCADILGDADLSRFAAPPHLDGELAWFKDQGLRLGAVSNTTTRSEVLDAFLEAVGVRQLFDAVVYSSVHGYKKPHPSIYDRALSELGVDAGSAVFVGDRVREDVVGPQAVGMRAVLTRQYRQEPLAGEHPLAVIQSLADLRRLLESFQD